MNRDGTTLAVDVVAAQSGDAAAFTRLVASTQNLVCSISLAMLRDVSASEDVAQEVFVNAWYNLSTLRDAALFLPWLKQLTRRASLNYLRSERRRSRRESETELPNESDAASPLLRHEEMQTLASCIDALPENSRELMVLFYREEASVSRVASLLELPEDTVKKRLQRARETVRESVLHRFGETAQRSAPAAAFTAAVSAALLTSAPPAVAATTLGAAKASSSLGVMPWFASAGIGIVGGLGGVVLGYWLYASALAERRAKDALLRLSLVSGSLIVAWALAFSACVALGVSSLVLLVSYAALVASHAWLYVVELPKVLELPTLDSHSTIRRRYRWFMTAFLLGITTGTLTLVLAIQQRH